MIYIKIVYHYNSDYKAYKQRITDAKFLHRGIDQTDALETRSSSNITRVSINKLFYILQINSYHGRYQVINCSLIT